MAATGTPTGHFGWVVDAVLADRARAEASLAAGDRQVAFTTGSGRPFKLVCGTVRQILDAS